HAREPHDRGEPECPRRRRQSHPEPQDARAGRSHRRPRLRRARSAAGAYGVRPCPRGGNAHGRHRLACNAQRAHARLQPAVLQGSACVRDADGARGVGGAHRAWLSHGSSRRVGAAPEALHEGRDGGSPRRARRASPRARSAAHALPLRRQPPAPLRSPLARGVLALEYVDGLIGRVLDGLPDETTVFVVSDHGFLPSTREIRPNVRLRRLGAEREARFVMNHGAGALYALDGDARAIAQLAAEIATMEGVSGAWTAAAYAGLGLPTPADNPFVADAMFEATPGYAFGDGAAGEEEHGAPKYLGN